MCDYLFSRLESTEAEKRDRRFLSYIDGEDRLCEVSYRHFARDVRRAIGRLSEWIPDLCGAHVAILAGKSYEYLVCLYALIGAGAVAVPMNDRETPERIARQIELGEIAHILTDGEYGAFYPEFGARFAPLLLPIGESLCGENEAPWQKHDPASTAMMLFTSGTTGNSKAVTISRSALSSGTRGFAEYYEKLLENRYVSRICFFYCLSFYHTFPLGMLFAAAANGYEIALNLEERYIERDIARLPCTCTAMVPIIIGMLVRRARRGRFGEMDKLETILCAGAPLTEDLRDELNAMGIHVTINYALTEFFNGTYNLCTDPGKRDSVGVPFGDCRVCIGEGEVLFSGGAMMDGYYHDPEATDAAIRDGWLHTGDLGYLDADGYLYLTGRKKNLIILESGENVSAEELEALLAHDTRIIDVRVMEKEGRICARIYAAAEERAAIEAGIRERNGALPMYKRIRLIEFTDEPLPKTASGKIKRN